MFLLFDTETTGVNRKSDRIVQIAWMILDNNLKIKEEQSHVIKPVGFKIPVESTRIHGISQEFASLNGVPACGVLSSLAQKREAIHCLIAHNLSFDSAFLRRAFSLEGKKFPFEDTPSVCTMKESTNFCNLRRAGSKTPKWPKLEELHQILFNKGFDGAHNALEDCRATQRCLVELVRRKVIDIPILMTPKYFHQTSTGGTLDKYSRGVGIPLQPLVSQKENTFIPKEDVGRKGTERLQFYCQSCKRPFTVTLHASEEVALCGFCFSANPRIGGFTKENQSSTNPVREDIESGGRMPRIVVENALLKRNLADLSSVAKIESESRKRIQELSIENASLKKELVNLRDSVKHSEEFVRSMEGVLAENRALHRELADLRASANMNKEISLRLQELLAENESLRRELTHLRISSADKTSGVRFKELKAEIGALKKQLAGLGIAPPADREIGLLIQEVQRENGFLKWELAVANEKLKKSSLQNTKPYAFHIEPAAKNADDSPGTTQMTSCSETRFVAPTLSNGKNSLGSKAFTPAYKGAMLKTRGINHSLASHVAEGEHLTSCPLCGTQRIVRTGKNSYPIGYEVICRNCHHSFQIN